MKITFHAKLRKFMHPNVTWYCGVW